MKLLRCIALADTLWHVWIWVLKVSINCEGCKRKVKKILHSVEVPCYGIHSTTDDKLKAYVEIHGVPNFPHTLRFVGMTSTEVNLSQKTAARKAISFLRNTYNVDIGDYNYYQMKLLEDNYRHLLFLYNKMF
ncbi:uncharacterized protein LOC125495988 [Beta vulgaris subsp. vulgaris]|uniref:uncharacterized protein LOC125495988 n=1 Tax=Beta vulgaris subsp. vulgaris TaxID=3555 RepID=UPI00203741D1|nr:uncharacterized protein LOC125495988 [Beta vulgaris subsp. vulgaris]